MNEPETASSAERADPVTPDAIMQLGLGFWGSKVLLSAVELGLFAVLCGGPLDAEELRTRLGLLLDVDLGEVGAFAPQKFLCGGAIRAPAPRIDGHGLHRGSLPKSDIGSENRSQAGDRAASGPGRM